MIIFLNINISLHTSSSTYKFFLKTCSTCTKTVKNNRHNTISVSKLRYVAQLLFFLKINTIVLVTHYQYDKHLAASLLLLYSYKTRPRQPCAHLGKQWVADVADNQWKYTSQRQRSTSVAARHSTLVLTAASARQHNFRFSWRLSS